jgi:hypothetical protein
VAGGDGVTPYYDADRRTDMRGGDPGVKFNTIGRNSVLIDLDPRSVHLVRQRITDNLHIISEETDGNTWRWTVETVTRQEIEAITAGQETLW